MNWRAIGIGVLFLLVMAGLWAFLLSEMDTHPIATVPDDHTKHPAYRARMP